MKNWRTSLLGIALGAGQIIHTSLQANQQVDWIGLLIGVGFAALGLAAKDSQVTGGTIKQ
jgi:hypothetical protein